MMQLHSIQRFRLPLRVVLVASCLFPLCQSHVQNQRQRTIPNFGRDLIEIILNRFCSLANVSDFYVFLGIR